MAQVTFGTAESEAMVRAMPNGSHWLRLSPIPRAAGAVLVFQFACTRFYVYRGGFDCSDGMKRSGARRRGVAKRDSPYSHVPFRVRHVEIQLEVDTQWLSDVEPISRNPELPRAASTASR